LKKQLLTAPGRPKIAKNAHAVTNLG